MLRVRGLCPAQPRGAGWVSGPGRACGGLEGVAEGRYQEGDSRLRKDARDNPVGETEAREIGRVAVLTEQADPSPSWAWTQGPFLGVQRPRVGVSLRTASPLPPAAPGPSTPTQQGSQGLCGEAAGKRGPLSALHLAGGSADASPPAPLGSPSWGCQPPPARCHCPLPSPAVSWSLRALAPGPAEGWRVPRPQRLPRLPFHTLAPEPWERRAAAGHRCPALPTPSPADLGEGRAERQAGCPKQPLQDGP